MHRKGAFLGAGPPRYRGPPLTFSAPPSTSPILEFVISLSNNLLLAKMDCNVQCIFIILIHYYFYVFQPLSKAPTMSCVDKCAMSLNPIDENFCP